jgi:hypothetical protein
MTYETSSVDVVFGLALAVTPFFVHVFFSITRFVRTALVCTILWGGYIFFIARSEEAKMWLPVALLQSGIIYFLWVVASGYVGAKLRLKRINPRKA